MNKNIVFISTLGLMLVGCEAHMVGNPPDCPAQRSKRCTGDPQAPTINVNTKATKLKAAPYCVKAKKGTVLVFRLTPSRNKGEGVAKISPKNPDHSWLAGTNDKYQDLILIDVPEDLPAGNYDYKIETDTDCVDPRVNVD